MYAQIFGMLPKQLSKLFQETTGATAIEYGLLAGLIAVGLAGGLGALSDLVHLLFDMIIGETTEVAETLDQ